MAEATAITVAAGPTYTEVSLLHKPVDLLDKRLVASDVLFPEICELRQETHEWNLWWLLSILHRSLMSKVVSKVEGRLTHDPCYTCLIHLEQLCRR